MNAQETITRLREIRHHFSLHYAVDSALKGLEIELAGTAQEDFTCDIVGFDTVLSYLARTNPEALDLIENPVHGTISDGVFLTKRAHTRGLPVLKIAACEHMKRRFPKATHVNAYPTHLLAEFYG